MTWPNNQATVFGPYSTRDREQVEMLRGSQSTQQGRTALAGAIVIRSKDPTHEFEVKDRGEIGERDTVGGSLAVNLPVIEDRVALRVSADRRSTAGFVTNVTLGENDLDRRDLPRDERTGGNGVSCPPRQAGPVAVSATALAGILEAGIDPLRPGARAEIYVELAEGRHRDARRIRAAVSTAPPTATPGALVEGPKGLARARIGLPETLGPELALWITVEGWDGRRHRAHWPLLGGRDSRKEPSP